MSEHNRDYDTPPQIIKNQKPPKFKRKPTKVTFISNPVKVKANDASEFRSIVQELTGKNSDMSSEIWALNDATTVTELPRSSEVYGAVNNRGAQYMGKEIVPSSTSSSKVGVSTGDDVLFWRDVVPESLIGFCPSAFLDFENVYVA